MRALLDLLDEHLFTVEERANADEAGLIDYGSACSCGGMRFGRHHNEHLADVVLAWVTETLEDPDLIAAMAALIDAHVSRADRGAPFVAALVQIVLTERSGLAKDDA